MSVSVRAPDGRVWKIRRALEWPRWRRTGLGLLDAADFFDASLLVSDTPLAGFALMIALALLLAIFVIVFLPLVLFLVELILLVPTVMLVLRPWRIRATTEGPPPERLEWRVRGWRGSRAALGQVARALERGSWAAPENAE